MNKFTPEEEINCPHFSRCSGCNIKYIYNPPILKEMETFFCDNAKLEKGFQCYFNDINQCRYKAKLAIRKKRDEIKIGLFKAYSHIVLDIPDCIVHKKEINRACIILKKYLAKENISIYSENTKKGLVRYLQFFVEKKTQKVQLVFVLNQKKEKSILFFKQFAKKIFKENNIFHSIWVNFQPKNVNTIFSNDWLLLCGREFLYQKTKDVLVAFHPASFAQANFKLFEKMIGIIQKNVSIGSNALELFAGNGCIGLNLVSICKAVDFIERNPYSKRSFDETMKINNIQNAKFIESDVDLFSGVKKNELDDYDYLIVDPPRKGLGSKILNWIIESKIENLIYVSCSFDSFKKDAKFLLNNCFEIKKAYGFSFFPGTNQIETLSFFKKKSE